MPSRPQTAPPSTAAAAAPGAPSAPAKATEIPISQGTPSPSANSAGSADLQSVPTAKLAGGRVLRYRAHQPQAESVNWREFAKGAELRHLILPISFMVLAVVIRFGLVFAGDSTGAQQTIVNLGIALGTMALNTVTLFIGLAAVAWFTGAELGPLPLTIIKLMSAGMLGSVIMGVAAAFEMKGLQASILAFHLVALLYWILFSIFFELDLQETLMAVALIGFMQAGTMCILWQK